MLARFLKEDEGAGASLVDSELDAVQDGPLATGGMESVGDARSISKLNHSEQIFRFGAVGIFLSATNSN